MSLSTGQVLNQRYRIVKLLGQGGFGAVYRAWDMNFQSPCALKENFETSPEAQRQFQREAQILHTLRHPGLPLVKDYFVIPGQGQYLVMDYVEGDDLQTWLERAGKPLDEIQVTRWLVQVCESLVYLHSQAPAVIHRDIKPANIRISGATEGGGGKAILVDFGIAKVSQPGTPTTQGARAVTPGYAPFEQYGHAPTDARTDIYALGATAYALLAGQPPTESIARMAGSEMPAPRSLNPALSPQMERIIARALAIMPGERFQSAGDLLADLKALLAQLETAAVDQPAKGEPEPFLPVLGNAFGGSVSTREMTPAAAPAVPVQQPVPVRQAQSPGAGAKKKQQKKRRLAWLWWMLIVLLLVGLLGFGWWNGWFPAVGGSAEGLGGNWDGNLYSVDSGRVEVHLEVVLPPGERFFTGILEMRFVERENRFERIFFEGTIDGAEFRLQETGNPDGLHLWGSLEGNRLNGFAGWGCYFCPEPWGEFELSR